MTSATTKSAGNTNITVKTLTTTASITRGCCWDSLHDAGYRHYRHEPLLLLQILLPLSTVGLVDTGYGYGHDANDEQEAKRHVAHSYLHEANCAL
jgi:hypothetical protein